MHKKIFALVFFAFLIGLIEACICSSEKTPFFDYHKLQILAGPCVNGMDTVQCFTLTPDSVEYVASIYQLALTTAAFGTSCPEAGEQGAKFNMTNFEIFSNIDFNDTLQSGESLSSLFYFLYATDNAQNILGTLPEMEFYLPYAQTPIYTPHLPSDTSKVFELTMRITKSDGSVAEGKLGGVKFK